jgi:hypothetical protein
MICGSKSLPSYRPRQSKDSFWLSTGGAPWAMAATGGERTAMSADPLKGGLLFHTACLNCACSLTQSARRAKNDAIRNTTGDE